MKKIINKKNIIVILITAFLLFLLESKSFAIGAQARKEGNPLCNKNISEFFELIRAMETPTGTLGKSSNINTNSDYLDTSGNGIDCHMEKNTEYGTITILAASEFGIIPSSDGQTTAKNNTGVAQMGTGISEYVASTLQSSAEANPYNCDSSYIKALVNADDRYKNKYVGAEKYSITGDGIIETDGWGSGYSYFVSSSGPQFGRGYGGIFGYSNYSGYPNTASFCRAVVVCGPGL